MGVYFIKNKGTSTYLATSTTSIGNHTSITVADKSNNDDKALSKFKWNLKSLTDNTYIRSVINPRYTLNAYRNTAIPYTCDVYDIFDNVDDDTLVGLEDSTSAGYKKICLIGRNLYLTVVGTSLKWSISNNSNDNQLWQFEYIGNMGCDTAANLSDSRLSALTAYDFGFVGRYLNYASGGHNALTKDEISRIMDDSDMFIYSLYQENMVPGIDGFTSAAGTSHADNAVSLTNEFGQPANTPIYFAIDRDIEANDCSQLYGYLNAIKVYLDNSSNNPNNYKLGVYACSNLCQYIVDNIDANAYTMKAYAYDYYDESFTDWNIYQSSPSIGIYNSDFSVDMNLSSLAGGGGWRITT